jgi:hypothetical protein
MTVGSSSDDFEVAAYFGARPSASTPGEAAEGTCVGDACCYYPSSTPWGYGTLSAGTVSVTDGASTLVALDPADASAGYTTVTSPAWRPGDVLSVSATGGEITSFAGLVAVPEPILFASPAAWDATALSTSADLTFSWTPATPSASRVWLSLVASSAGSGPGGVVQCSVADAAGVMT